jgi:outer membrane protein assembly factor BamB
MSGSDPGPGHRDALFVAAGRYQDPMFAALRSPSRDAAELAEVLADPAIGGFGTRVLLDEPGHVLLEEIDGFFADRRAEDVLVLYLSCHGVKDVAGGLHFAVSTTKFSRLASTAIPAGFVYEQLDLCLAGKVLVLLDCCYSGAYAKGHRPKAGGRAEVKPFGGRGRAVITSCTAIEYAFEVGTEKVADMAGSSVFTAALVGGLRTGRADRDGDGQVSIDELYDYVFDRVREVTPHQTPEKMWGNIRGDFIIAANPKPPAPPALPAAQAANGARQPTARRALLGMTAAIAAGLAITGWDLAQPTTHNPKPPAKPVALWTHPPGYAQLASWGPVTEGLVYAVTNSELYALRASDGDRAWSASANASSGAQMSSKYILTWSNGLTSTHPFALRASDGHIAWHSQLECTTPVVGPVVVGDVAYVADGNGEIHSLRVSDGTKTWSSASGTGTPAGIAVAGGFAYIAGGNSESTAGNVCAVNISGGVNVWNSAIDEGPMIGPVVAGDMLYVACLGRINAMRVGDGTKSWGFDADWILHARGVVYAGTRQQLFALDAKDGDKLWSYPGAWSAFPGESPGTVMPAGSLAYVAGDIVYAADGHGEVHALRASNGAKIWSFPTGSPVAAIASAHNVVYIASNNIYAMSAKDGTLIWSTPIGISGYDAMVLVENILYVGSVTSVTALRV